MLPLRWADERVQRYCDERHAVRDDDIVVGHDITGFEAPSKMMGIEQGDEGS